MGPHAGFEVRAAKIQRQVERRRYEQAEDERRVAMARSVSVLADVLPTPDAAAVADAYPEVDRGSLPASQCWMHLALHVHNDGDYPIEDVVVEVGETPVDEGEAEEVAGPPPHIVVGTVPAGATHDETKIVYFADEPDSTELPYLSTVIFRDTYGEYWRRADGELERGAEPPMGY